MFAGEREYEVLARRWDDGWELYIEDVGVTQSHTLSDAGWMARDYLASALGGHPDDYEVIVTVDDPGDPS